MKRYPLQFVAEHHKNLTPELILSRLGRFWFDTASAAGPQVIGSLTPIVDSSRILFGTDWPYIADTQVESTIRTLDQTIADASLREQIYRDNAVRLFPRIG